MPSGTLGLNVTSPRAQGLDAHNVHLEHVSHENPGDGDRADQEKREIIRRKRDVSHLGNEDPSENKEGHRPQQHKPAEQHARQHEPVRWAQCRLA